MEEIWKDIEGYEGLYQVSNCGNVKSIHYRKTNKEKILIPKCNNSGRLWVELWNSGKARQFLIHRLVASAFIENPDCLPQINHIDENPKNNKVENLEWCTGSYNVKTYFKNHPEFFTNRKVRTTKNGRKLLLDCEIEQCLKDGTVIRIWPNSRFAAVEMNWSQWSISECCRGKRKTAYGYIWRFAN